MGRRSNTTENRWRGQGWEQGHCMLVRCAWECLFLEPGSACAASQCEELKLPAMQTGFSRRPSQCLRRLVPCHITEHPGNHGMVQPGLPPSLWPGAAGAPRGSAFPRAGPFPGAGPGRAGPAALGQQGGAGSSGRRAKPELSQGCLRQRSLSALPGAQELPQGPTPAPAIHRPCATHPAPALC